MRPLYEIETFGYESYLPMRGENQIVKAGEMMNSDRLEIISNIIDGPDQWMHFTAATRSVVFTVYAPV